MLFNSIDFLVYFPLVFVLYWFVTSHSLKLQNGLIIVASYVFYGWWDWRFLSLIVFSTMVDYFVGRSLGKTESKRNRKFLLYLSVFVNIGFLAFFKYYNFFLDSFISAFTFMGNDISSSGLNIILPVGISFYTFQTLSYSIDVFNRKIEPTKDYLSFSAFVCFFPQLVAGPIERATNLLPQFYKKRIFDTKKALDGFYLFIYGLFKKVVIADSCAIYVNEIYIDQIELNSLSLILGAVYFSFQIYCDFSGYSDMAIGLSRMLGFDLMRNFKFPYFSRDIAEFWRRWHISLSTWFRDYVYFPLGGSKLGNMKGIRNTFIIFTVSGFWHGANWTFIFWGALNALFFIPLLITGKNRRYFDVVSVDTQLPNLTEFLQMLSTFLLITLGWVFFRSDSIGQAFSYLSCIGSFDLEGGVQRVVGRYVIELLPLIFIFITVEWHSRKYEHPFFGKFLNFKIFIILILILLFGAFSNPKDFIYFQF